MRAFSLLDQICHILEKAYLGSIDSKEFTAGGMLIVVAVERC